jgi:hypothetical protein
MQGRGPRPFLCTMPLPNRRGCRVGTPSVAPVGPYAMRAAYIRAAYIHAALVKVPYVLQSKVPYVLPTSKGSHTRSLLLLTYSPAPLFSWPHMYLTSEFSVLPPDKVGWTCWSRRNRRAWPFRRYWQALGRPSLQCSQVDAHQGQHIIYI